MPRTRIKPPMCMGRRMAKSDPDKRSYWFVVVPEVGATVYIDRLLSGKWQWRGVLYGVEVAYGQVAGEQAAANAAERWLVKRAELTLKLAGRRAA